MNVRLNAVKHLAWVSNSIASNGASEMLRSALPDGLLFAC
jgi:hypothetical protein